MIEVKEVFTVIDFETTGLDHNSDQVLEVAAIRTDLDQEYGRLHLTIALEEERELPEVVRNLTGITEDALKGGATEFAAMIALAGFIGNSTVVAHYAPFDVAFLSRYQLDPSFFFCTRSIERILNPKESASLGPTTERYGIKLEGAHRALADVEAAAALLRAQFEEITRRGLHMRDFRNAIVDSAERPNRFTPKYAVVKKM